MKSGYDRKGNILIIDEKEQGDEIIKVLKPEESKHLINCMVTAIRESGGEEYKV